MTKVSGYDGENIKIPSGWQKCDGSIINSPSPWEGKLTPDLNNAKRFLRGGPDSHQLRLEDDSLRGHTHGTSDRFFLGLYGDHSCPSGSSLYDDIGIDNEGKQDDKICERHFNTGSTGDSETRPKNMNVIFIMRVF